jgi:hypothetical protein
MSTVRRAEFTAEDLRALTQDALEIALLQRGFRFSGERRIAFLLPFVSNIAGDTTMMIGKNDGGVTFTQEKCE